MISHWLRHPGSVRAWHACRTRGWPVSRREAGGRVADRGKREPHRKTGEPAPSRESLGTAAPTGLLAKAASGKRSKSAVGARSTAQSLSNSLMRSLEGSASTRLTMRRASSGRVVAALRSGGRAACTEDTTTRHAAHEISRWTRSQIMSRPDEHALDAPRRLDTKPSATPSGREKQTRDQGGWRGRSTAPMTEPPE